MTGIPAQRVRKPHEGSRYLSQVVGQRILEARRFRDIDKVALADRMQHLGHPKWWRQTVGQVESANRNLTLDELISLAAALQTTLAFLLSPASAWDPEYSRPVDVGAAESLEDRQLSDLYGFHWLPYPHTNGYYEWPEVVWKEAGERMPPIADRAPREVIEDEH